MDIHKPKPIHGWRDFFKEVGIIVLGVSIALGAEQSVEAIHESHIAAEARNAVRAEVRENLWWLDRRARYEPCITQRLAELGQILVHVRDGDAVPVDLNVGGVGHVKMTTLRWEANSQAGRTSLFSEDEQRVLGNIYFTTKQFSEAQAEEEVIWAKMQFIQGLSQLTPLDTHDFGIFLAEARYENRIALLTIRRAHQWADRMHLTAENPDGVEGEFDANRAPICPPLTAGKK
jgi:hypothetical protein